MNKVVTNFKPEPISVVLGDVEYTLVFDLNAFCEMEKIYDSIDAVLAMLLGTQDIPDLSRVTYCDAPCLADDIKVAGVPLSVYIEQNSKGVRVAKQEDTRNLLWLGCLHDHTVFDEDGNIVKYTIGKGTLGKFVNLRNIKEINAKVVTALLRDLIPATNDGEAKNVEPATPETEAAE